MQEKDFGKQASQRIATFLLFLSDVEEGGETVFKREGKNSEWGRVEIVSRYEMPYIASGWIE